MGLPNFETEPSPLEQRLNLESRSRLLSLRMDAFASEVIAPLCDQTGYNYMQQRTLEVLRDDLRPDQTVDCPTRTGKSYLIRHIAAQSAAVGGQTAIFSHRSSIIAEHRYELAESGTSIGSLFNEDDTEASVTADTLGMLLSAVKSERVADYRYSSVDTVLIDEAHRALGIKTRSALRKLFPDAVFVVFTASPDFAENRSVTDEYGAKIVSYPPVEAIESGLVPPVRLFMYKTDAVIDNMDPAAADFTPRELKRVAEHYARNEAIVDIVHDLVQDGRQALISTIPGENLLHADVLLERISKRAIKLPDGQTRRIRARVVRGTDSDGGIETRDDLDHGYLDVALFCDFWTESIKLRTVSVLVNGRPTSSMVNLTQQMGRPQEPKDIETTYVDFFDTSLGKRQRTMLDVLELDRTVQGVRIGPSVDGPPDYSVGPRDSYMRALFRPELAKAFMSIDMVKVAELTYGPKEEELSPYDKKLKEFLALRRRELAKLTRYYDKILAKHRETPDQPDYFTAGPHRRSSPRWFGVVDSDDEFVTDGAGHELEVYDMGHVDTWDSPSAYRALPAIHDSYLLPHMVLPTIPSSPEIEEWGASTAEAAAYEDSMDPATLRELMSYELDDAMSGQNERDKNIVRMRFGLDDDDGAPKTLEQVGNEFGIQSERVRQVEARMLSHMRHPSRAPGLLALLGLDEERRHWGPTRQEEIDFQRAARRKREAFQAAQLQRTIEHIGTDHGKLVQGSAQSMVNQLFTQHSALFSYRDQLPSMVRSEQFTEALSTNIINMAARSFIKYQEYRGHYNGPEINSEDDGHIRNLIYRGFYDVLNSGQPHITERWRSALDWLVNYQKHVQPRYHDPVFAANKFLRRLMPAPKPKRS